MNADPARDNQPNPDPSARPTRAAGDKKKDAAAFWIAAGISVVGILLALWVLLAKLDPTPVAAVAATLAFASGACKLVGAAKDISPFAKDKLDLWAQALALFGGSGGIAAIVTALTAS